MRFIAKGGATADERITFGYRLVLARHPSAEELEIVRAALGEHLAKYQAAPEAAGKLLRQGESPPRAGLAEPELAAWTLIANLLLNLDETITRN